MPLIQNNHYRPPIYLRSGHFQTIYPTLFRKVPLVTDERERIKTPDGDFIDLDWKRSQPSKKLVVISHGLEGHGHSQYCQGMARTLVQDGWQVCIWNFRGCSGEPNHRLQSYHSGATEDLQCVINHILKSKHYEHISLIGFSLGGNLSLKYIAEAGHNLPANIRSAVGVSVACDLESCAKKLERWDNRIYMRRFLKSLTDKVRYKMECFPGEIKDHGLKTMRTFQQFDDAYTAPIHGFKDANEYWSQCSCGPKLSDIQIPTLLVNAQYDPFLTSKCFPYETARDSKFLNFEATKYGGHMGFMLGLQTTQNYAELRTSQFLKEYA